MKNLLCDIHDISSFMCFIIMNLTIVWSKLINIKSTTKQTKHDSRRYYLEIREYDDSIHKSKCHKIPFLMRLHMRFYVTHHYYQVLRHVHCDKVNNHGICWIHAWFNNYYNQVLVYVSHPVPCKCGLVKVVTDLTPNYIFNNVTKACDIHDRDTCLSIFKDVHIALHDSGIAELLFTACDTLVISLWHSKWQPC